MNQSPPFAAIILCGGESRRMGRAKALLPWRSVTLVEHLVATLAPIARPIIVVAAPEQVLPALPADVLLARDAIAGEGPLRGLEAGLAALADAGTEVTAAFVCGCDMPELSLAVVIWIMSALKDHPAVVIEHEGHWQPLHAVYRLDLLPALRAALAAGERSPQRWLRTLHPRVVLAETLGDIDPELRTLRNMNSPDEYDRLEKSQNLE